MAEFSKAKLLSLKFLNMKGMIKAMAHIEVNENLCKGCEMCVHACPKKIIELDREKLNAKGYHPARLREADKCIGCKACAVMCPDIAITVYR